MDRRDDDEDKWDNDDEWDEEEDRSPYDDFFDRFFGFSRRSPFKDMFKEFERMFKQMQEDMEQFHPKSHKDKKKTYTYGFNVFIGPDGKPRIKEFGNLEPFRRDNVRKEEYEPSTSTYTEDNKLIVVVDLPGVDKEDIDVKAGKEEVEIKAVNEDRKYSTIVDLPKKVQPATAEANYENGVLTLSFEIEKEEREEKKDLEIK